MENKSYNLKEAMAVKTYKPNALRGALSYSYAFILVGICSLPLIILGVIGAFSTNQIIVGEILIVIFFLISVFPFLAISLKLASQSYEIKPDRIEMKRGILFKSLMVIPYSKIHNVRKFEGLLSGIMHTCDLILITPMSSETLLSLNETAADELKDFVLKSTGKPIQTPESLEIQNYFIGLEKSVLYKFIITFASILVLIILYFYR